MQVQRMYKWIQAMSLDVVLGSGLLTLSIARYYQVPLPLSVVSGLMIAVWAIYTFDHLSDAKRVGKAASTHRHRYHQQHYQALKIALLLTILGGIAIAFVLPPLVVKWAIICAACVALYFMLLKLFQPAWFKEFLVAICYTTGVFLGPLCLSQVSLNLFQLLLIIQIFLLAMANLVIFSCFDYKTDQQDGHYSLALHLGLARTRKIALGLVGIGLALGAPLFFTARLSITQEVQLLIFAMNLLLLMLLVKEKHFHRNGLYRIIGDGVFFIPSLILFYAR